MRLSGLIEDFRVRVRVSGSVGPIHTRQLSEGEQQLLTVLGLMRFTRNEGSLYILDEPDTHLNPAWGVEYLDYLRKVGGIHRNSHTLLATHDPLLVAGLCREEIRVLTRGSDGRIVAATPEENPRGTGVASVLTSPLATKGSGPRSRCGPAEYADYLTRLLVARLRVPELPIILNACESAASRYRHEWWKVGLLSRSRFACRGRNTLFTDQ